MIDKDISLDSTRTSCLRPKAKEGIETGGILTPEESSDISTGNLLAPKNASDISTGNLLSAEVIAGIETGGLLTPVALPADSDFPLNYARIGYNNVLTTFGSTSSDLEGAYNLLTPSTYDKWRPAGDDAVVLVADTPTQCDYVGIAAHNFGSENIFVEVEVSPGLGEPHVIIYSGYPTSDKALFIRFDSGIYDRVFLNVAGSTSTEVGVLFMGLELEMMRPIFTGHSPATLSATDVMTPQVSDGGQFLGKQIVRQGYGTNAEFQHLTDEWYRDKFQPFVEHAKTLPYFWAWNLLESPDDVVYGWTNENISPSYMGIRNWFSVSFSIEAHA